MFFHARAWTENPPLFSLGSGTSVKSINPPVLLLVVLKVGWRWSGKSQWKHSFKTMWTVEGKCHTNMCLVCGLWPGHSLPHPSEWLRLFLEPFGCIHFHWLLKWDILFSSGGLTLRQLDLFFQILLHKDEFYYYSVLLYLYNIIQLDK